MKASDLFVKALEAEGVEYIFGIPGEENLDLLESLKDSSIELVVTRHEQAAGFMAATYGRLTGKAGVCLSTLGPGATNLVTAAAYAQLGAMPMLMITGQKPIKSSKQGHFQIIDIVDMLRPITKYTHQIVNGNNIPVKVREAFRSAQEERPGAVHLELPEDIAQETTSALLFPIEKVRRPAPDEKAVRLAVDMIKKAKHPLIMLGAGANRYRNSKMMRRLIDKTKIPFFNTQMGKGVIDEKDPLFLGNAALSDNDFVHCAIDKADLIINVGHDVVEKPPFFMKHGGFEVIHINYSGAVVDNVYFPQLEVIGDIANTLWQLSEALDGYDGWDFREFMRVKEDYEKHLMEGTDDDAFPVKPRRLVADVRKAVPSDGIIALDNGMYKIWFARNYKAHLPNTVLLDNALASMGAGLPSAMGAKYINNGRKVLAICGDGGFMMNSQELETAVRNNLDLVVLILNDSAYGMIKWKQTELGYSDYGLDFDNPDFVKYAESYGATGVRIERTEDLLPTLEKCLDEKGVHVIDLPVDYSDNQKVLVKQLKERTCVL